MQLSSSLLQAVANARNAFEPGVLNASTLSATSWQELAERLATKPQWTLLDLWAEPDRVHMAILEEAAAHAIVVNLPCPSHTFPSVGRLHAPAIRLERAVRDLYGHIPVDASDARPWLDHGRWPLSQPLGKGAFAPPATPAAYSFLQAAGEALHQISVGPVHAGIIEPGHFRFSAAGEAIVRLEQRLGYVHKGIEGLMAGSSFDRAARLAARVSGDSTVAFSFAFARAVESALGLEVPARAAWLRGLMAELERVANHLGDIGAICNDASFTILHAHCGALREHTLRAASVAFGHRLMMDAIVPGGIARDLDADGATAIRALCVALRTRLPPLIDLYDNTASLQDRTAGTGVLSAELALRFGAGGYVGRASGRGVDARKLCPYPPYDRLELVVPVVDAGDVNARVWIRIEEVYASLALIEQILDGLPTGPSPIVTGERARPIVEREGVAWVEGFRGDIFAWVRTDDHGGIAHCRLRDPSWFQWPLLEAVIEGNIVADFPLCNKSFNCSYSGHDL